MPAAVLLVRNGGAGYKRIIAVPRSNPQYLIGIDEAGRGPLAGPAVVAGIRIRYQDRNLSLWRSIRDSKKLSPKKREEWYRILTGHPGIAWARTRVGHQTIDRRNIARAIDGGVIRVYQHLLRPRPCHALLDGGLRLPSTVWHDTIPKGDEHIPVIAAASIIAKVTRDRIMRRLHHRWPCYRFDLHKGYGTRLHREMLTRHGHSPAHRVSFRWKTPIPKS